MGLAAAASLLVEHDDAEACAGWEPSIADMTTFDPGVLGDDAWGGLEYDPFTEGYGGGCAECSTKAMLADWQGYLKEAVTPADWEQVLMKASLADIFAIEQKLAGKSQNAPKGFETSSLWTNAAAQKQLYGAIEFVELLKRMEPNVTFDMYEQKQRPADPLVKELAAAQRGQKAAKDPFLQQRYGFAVLRALFYRKEWAKAVTYFDTNLAMLSTPSQDLKWRARYYIAGALRKDGKAARANLELARIHAGYYPLTGLAIQDFKPAEEADWKDALKLAKDKGDKAAMWRMVGLKHDPLVAAQEILKLDPKSALVPLLVVRELGHTESLIDASFSNPADKTQVAAQKKAYARVETLALKLATTPAIAKPWLYDLIAGHIAAKRGDLATARTRMAKAVAGAPGDKRVASQAKASLAVALVADWKLNPQNEAELATLMKDIDPAFARMHSVKNEVRTKLAIAYATANKIVDAEFLAHTVTDDFDDGDTTLQRKVNAKWQSVPFLKEMIARTDQRTTEFDRFIVDGSHVKGDLQLDLAVRLTLDGDFAGAKAVFDKTTAKSELLRTDPFVIHVIDCHDCDHEKFGEKAKWTHRNLVERLAELELTAKGGGEAGAQAALALGNALYNLTHHGNARSFADPTHQSTTDARLAERYYKKVYDSSGNRELKAKAAWLAAKSELGTLIFKEQAARPEDFVDAGMMLPKTWFKVFAKFSNTKYYKEVLKECGRFRAYVASQP
ncbi:MAG: hypothetical protein ABI175_00825 [Polyangiales bacterium]